MTLFFQFIKKNFFFIFAILLFFGVRVYLLIHYPPDYSDVRTDYERYANMWWYGLPPYLKHLYEYPPATIPLLTIPLALDLSGIGHYYPNYRFQIFIIETIAYFVILKALNKIYYFSKLKYFPLIFYNFFPLIIKTYWYDGIDLVFSLSITLALVSLLFQTNKLASKIITWVLFWLSVAIKLVTLPLVIPYLIINKKGLTQELKASYFSFLIVWIIPLILFRTSLSTFLVFHAQRPLHSSSFPAFIVYTINHYTHSEEMINLEWFGPVTKKALTWSFVGLGLNCLTTFFYSLKLLKKINFQNRYLFHFRITFLYIFGFLFTSKILSTPFNIWYIPLLTIFPYKNFKQQLLMFVLVFWSYLFNATNVFNHTPYIPLIYPFTLNYLRHVFRWIPLIIILSMVLVMKTGKVIYKTKKTK